MVYTKKDSLEYYEKSSRAGDLIRYWLENESKGFMGNKLMNAKRQHFYPIVSSIISMLSRVTGKEDDFKF